MKKLPILLFLVTPLFQYAQQYSYKVNLTECKKDRVAVELSCPRLDKDTAYFNFPMTVPGTYAILNYGTYISDFKAFDENQKQLETKKIGANTFKIFPATNIKTITYQVRDSWDSKEKKHKIFEPAGTGFEKGKYFYINNGGLFGFFDNMLLFPFTIEFTKPSDLNGFTSLSCTSKKNNAQIFVAENYHILIDNPILFTSQKDKIIKVANADITVASYYNGNDSAGFYITSKLDSSMQAIEAFVGGTLPISNYNFLNYIVDLRDVGKILLSGNIRLYQYPKIMRKLGNQGFGALEHGTSSSYYLPDFGQNSYSGMVSETAIHEFMHIYTPLSLHSELIGNFNYVNPKMSKHLWLYEGVTEYFSTIIAMQGKLETIENTINHQLKNKIVSSYSYPDSIPFTVMSENVFTKPYLDLYDQVYERGAIMAMLLDFEIMKLTNGEKNLKSVVFELTSLYGKNKSFEEDEIIPMFVKLVHPNLQLFFDNYVVGKTPLDIEGGFKTIGINYQKEKKGIVPSDLLSKENGVIANTGIVINNRIAIKKAEKNNLAGFIIGDKVDRDEVLKCFQKENGDYVAEGDIVKLKVIRKEKEVVLSFPAKFKNGTLKNVFEISKDKTVEQENLFRLWTTGKN